MTKRLALILSGYIFPINYVFLVAIIAIQGFKWPGFFQKHTGFNPVNILFILTALWLLNLYSIKKYKKTGLFYGVLISSAKKIFIPMVILSMFLYPIYGDKDLYYKVVHRLSFHWTWFTESIWLIIIFAILVRTPLKDTFGLSVVFITSLLILFSSFFVSRD